MTTATPERDQATDEPELRRVMGQKLLLLFIVGDILGAGVYAVTGQMAGIVGGIVWVPFLIAFIVWVLTALSYKQGVLPRALGRVSHSRRAPYVGIAFSTVLALVLIWYVASRAKSDIVLNLASTTALLLLAVFAVVNIACLVLRRDAHSEDGFKSPGLTPLLAAALCLFLVGPWSTAMRSSTRSPSVCSPSASSSG